ncbi:MAG: GMP synthase (glutamine-hydrolyzing), partial [Christensenellaceae bacterium]
MNHETIVILDNGSAVGQLVSRATRDMGVYSLLAPFDIGQDKLQGYAPAGVIVIGGDEAALEKAKALGVPVMELE